MKPRQWSFAKVVLKVENRGPKVPKQAEAKGLLMKLCTLNLIQVFWLPNRQLQSYYQYIPLSSNSCIQLSQTMPECMFMPYVDTPNIHFERSEYVPVLFTSIVLHLTSRDPGLVKISDWNRCTNFKHDFTVILEKSPKSRFSKHFEKG